MAGTQKLFCKVEANYGMAAAVRIDNQDLLLILSRGSPESEGGNVGGSGNGGERGKRMGDGERG